MSGRLVVAHLRAQALELGRYPSFIVPTLCFPALFFLFFVTPRAHDRPNVFLASYMGFAVLGIAFFQFGVGIAGDRVAPWESYLRLLPVRPSTRFLARVLSALLFSVAAAAVVAAVAVLTTDASLPPARWAALVVAVLAGSIPFALLGIALGYWATPRGALPLANILYLSLSYLGGLWTGPGTLPHAVEHVSSYLPTRQYGEVLWNAVAGTFEPARWLVLAAYGVVFAAAAVQGYRRDEGQRFR